LCISCVIKCLFTNYSATAETTHEDVHVALIEKEKKRKIYVHFKSHESSAFQDSQAKGVKSSRKHLGCLHFYMQEVVSNSLLLVFYSEKRHGAYHSYVTNWNTSGYFEVSSSVSK